MAKRKYTRISEEPKGFKCTNCNWEGTPEERLSVMKEKSYQLRALCCPKCLNEEFYGLLEAPKK